MRNRWFVPALFLAGLLGAPQQASAQAQSGLISGRVTDSLSGQGLGAVQLNVVGTTLGSQTGSDGQYTIRGVAPGRVQVRVLRLGYGEQRLPVTVTSGGTATLDVRLHPVAMSLSPVVTTATGQQRRVEVGNSIAQVDVADIVATRAVASVGDALTSRAAGVYVLPGVQTGAGTRVRIRGTSSLSLTNNPIFIIDGVRVESSTGSSTVSVGGTLPSRSGDLNPEEIESIEVVRGPSAATLYGTDAANGVIVITTKRGQAGRTQWSHYTEQTALKDNNEYPTAYWGWRTGTTPATTSTPSNTVQCFLTQRAAGACVQDSVTSYNLHNDPQSTPYGVSYRAQYGSQMRGGTEAIRFFVHGEFEDEDGVTKVPEFEAAYLKARNRTLRSEQESPNRLTRYTGRTNLNILMPRNADLAVNFGYTSQDLRLPQSDDSGVTGVAANVYGGPGFKNNLNAAGDTLYGWRNFTPRDIYQGTTAQAIERMISSANANWRPSDWLSMRGNFGLDLINRKDTQICRFANCPDVGQDRLGYKRDNRTNFFVYTMDAAATANRRLSEQFESKTTAGFQFYRNILNRNGATGRLLPPGATTVTAGAIKEADETTSESRTLGGFVEQSIAWRDRLFLTGAVRSDRNSAFGADFETVFYPKLSASWVLSDETFFPKPSWLTQFRLRSAYGASGVQPGTIDAVQYFSATQVRGESGEEPGVVFSTLGNRTLKPERSEELELGLDASLWGGRITAEVTHYNKSSRDALISRTLPPSLGTGATTRLENLGKVKNSGWEALINVQVIQKDAIGWDVSFNGSTNDNELVSLGGVPAIIGTTQSQIEGYPLYGLWSRRLSGWNDRNGDGILTYNADPNLSEITVSAANEFHGYPLPRREFAFTNGLEFFKRRVRVAAMVDYKGGHLVYNNTERIRCASRNNCRGLIDPTAPLFEQARTVAVREHPSRTVAGFFEKGDFVRFRELAATFTAPPTWASRLFRGRSLMATLAARNLGILWTDYTGVDPEAFGTSGDAPSEFQAFGPPTFMSLRFTIGY
ncbi:MAG: SusC/RagA family TonB-linked outer membrane protein [Cytophagaceae bacterium]|nr:SusC/RagA family TonB-linked outer membrane protein [Gemmatimonadaceae bacterium]